MSLHSTPSPSFPPDSVQQSCFLYSCRWWMPERANPNTTGIFLTQLVATLEWSLSRSTLSIQVFLNSSYFYKINIPIIPSAQISHSNPDLPFSSKNQDSPFLAPAQLSPLSIPFNTSMGTSGFPCATLTSWFPLGHAPYQPSPFHQQHHYRPSSSTPPMLLLYSYPRSNPSTLLTKCDVFLFLSIHLSGHHLTPGFQHTVAHRPHPQGFVEPQVCSFITVQSVTALMLQGQS